MISERAFRMNFEEFQNQSRFYVVGALEPGEVGEALPPWISFFIHRWKKFGDIRDNVRSCRIWRFT
jgi:hypothetical protein